MMEGFWGWFFGRWWCPAALGIPLRLLREGGGSAWRRSSPCPLLKEGVKGGGSPAGRGEGGWGFAIWVEGGWVGGVRLLDVL